MSNLQEIKDLQMHALVNGQKNILLDVHYILYVIDQLEQAQSENEQLKADKQKLVEAIKDKISTFNKRIANMSKHETIHCDHSVRISGLESEAFIWERCLELIQALSEVKGNG